MIDVLRKALSWSMPAEPAPPTPMLAAAALMVEVARTDGGYNPAQRRIAADHLARLFALSPQDASNRMVEGEAEQAAAADLVRFTRVIKTGLDTEARSDLMAALWALVLADGHRHPHEDALMRKLPPLLALSDHDSARARQRALSEAIAPTSLGSGEANGH